MLTTSIILFSLAILGGLTMAALYFTGRKIPLPLGFGHGLLALGGLVVLFVVIFEQARYGMLAVSAGVFCVAAIGGLILISHALRGRQLPVGLLFLHACVAVLGYLLLSVALTPP